MLHTVRTHGRPLAVVIALALLVAAGVSVGRVAGAEDASPATAAGSWDATGGWGKAGERLSDEAPGAPRSGAAAGDNGLPPELERRGGDILAQALGGLGGAFVLLAAAYLLARRRVRR